MIASVSDFRDLARDPNHRRRFEKMLYLAAQRGDADLVAERLSWGIDPNCASLRGRTPLIANVRGPCPSVRVVRELLAAGADLTQPDETGACALDYARRKLARLQGRPDRAARTAPSLDENAQLQLGPEEQAELDRLRRECGGQDRDYLHTWWHERLRAARRLFNDRGQVERIVELLEGWEG
ncbi:MAG: ankyrin repeat domain-containing protein [Phycisphaerales bacterium]|nr:MAG: ankyrin repeat domain-containing protein [Phycisphaerales bacterium]